MEKVPGPLRGATFVSTIALADKGKLIGCAEGRIRGDIGFGPRGRNGFGYDPLFTAKGRTLTFAQMKPDFKNRISHRARALKKAKRLIEALQDEEIQKLAWEKHGFRTGLIGVQNDPKVLDIAGIPAEITHVIPMPSPQVMDRIITNLQP